MRQKSVFSRHSRKTIFMLFTLFASFANTLCLAALINYEKNPDLEQAMKYDAEYNGANLAISSQSKAEEYYLKYLETCKESSQRAKVYSQLGVLFASNIDTKKGEKPDFEKSVNYMKKALLEEPTRIGTETIRARCFLLGDTENQDEHIRIRMENYEWFLKTKELVAASDESSDIWLPEVPGKQIDSGEVLSRKDLFKSVEHVQKMNLLDAALYARDPIDRKKYLQSIVDRFPNTDIAQKASDGLTGVRTETVKDVRTGVMDTTSSSIPSRTESKEKTLEPLVENSLKSTTEKYELHSNGFPGSEPLLQKSLSGYFWIFLGYSTLVLLGAIAYSVVVRMKRPR